jgi:hypothetical protein
VQAFYDLIKSAFVGRKALKLEFSRQILEKHSNQISRHIRSAAAELFCGRTDMTKLIVALRSFANAPKSRCNERRTCRKNVLFNPIPNFQHFCPLLVKMR